MILLLVAWPVFVTIFLLKNYDSLNKVDFKRKYNAFYQGIKVTSFQAIIYNGVFSARRFDIVLDNLLFNEGSPITGVERTFYLEKIFIFLLI